jgi:transcriptional regulator with XRE-family HTH domain
MSTKTSLDDVVKTIGDNLYRLRKSRKESIETVAEANKIPPYLLNKLENGTYPNCLLSIIFRLCDYYNVTPKELVKGC